MRRLVLLAAILWPLLAPGVSAQQVAAPPVFYPNGSLAGTGLWDCYLCDVLGVRNLQGGKATDPNLSIGAGSSTHRGTIDFQFDVGTGRVLFFDGHKRRLLTIGPRKIVAYVPIVVRVRR